MIGATTRLGRKSPTAALQNSTLLFPFEPDGSPNYVTSDSASQPVPLTPGFIDYLSPFCASTRSSWSMFHFLLDLVFGFGSVG